MVYQVTKRYGHELGLSACFRQMDANSHCRFLHGYALAFTLEFQAHELNRTNWVVDFGGLKPFKEWLVSMFDHKLLVSERDHMLIEQAATLETMGIVEHIIVPRVGCEAFAEMAFTKMKSLLIDMGEHPRVKIIKATVNEHEANAASFSRPY